MMQAWADYLDLLKENGGAGKLIRKEDAVDGNRATTTAMAAAINN